MITVKEILEEFKRIQRAMSDFKTIENEIYKYNIADNVNMNYDKMNEFRHIVVGVYFASIGYSDLVIDFFGHAKAAYDF